MDYFLRFALQDLGLAPLNADELIFAQIFSVPVFTGPQGPIYERYFYSQHSKFELSGPHPARLPSLFQRLEFWLLPLYHEWKLPQNSAFKSVVLPMVVVMYFVFCTTGRGKKKEVNDSWKLLTLLCRLDKNG